MNRQIISDALQQHAGQRCLRAGHGGLDGILVSNAGAKFKVRAGGHAGGLVRTAMRSSDIMMDRVNQLELESFCNTPGVVFFPINKTVLSSQDSRAPHPEIQRHAASIRTDMDRFQPELAEIIVPTTTVDLPIAAIATFELINPKHNFRYVCRWRWIEEAEPK